MTTLFSLNLVFFFFPPQHQTIVDRGGKSETECANEMLSFQRMLKMTHEPSHLQNNLQLDCNFRLSISFGFHYTTTVHILYVYIIYTVWPWPFC